MLLAKQNVINTDFCVVISNQDSEGMIEQPPATVSL